MEIKSHEVNINRMCKTNNRQPTNLDSFRNLLSYETLDETHHIEN